FTSAFDFLQDVGGGGGPDEWLWVLVVMFNIVSNSRDEFIDGAEDSMAKPAFGEITKETFDHVQPRGTGRREVNVEALVPFHPCLDVGMLVRGVVVTNDVNVFVSGRIPFDHVQESDP